MPKTIQFVSRMLSFSDSGIMRFCACLVLRIIGDFLHNWRKHTLFSNLHIIHLFHKLNFAVRDNRLQPVLMWNAPFYSTPCLKKLCKIVFVRTSSNFHQFLKMAKRLELCDVHSLSTSPDSRHHTTVLNTDVPNCYTTL